MESLLDDQNNDGDVFEKLIDRSQLEIFEQNKLLRSDIN